MTLSEAREGGYKSDRECVNQGAYIMEGRTMTGLVLEGIGLEILLGPLPNRWNPDGSWNW